MNNQNLIPLNQRTPEEAKYICSLGGKSRQQQIIRRKHIQKQFQEYIEKEQILNELLLEYLSLHKEEVKQLWRNSKRRYKKIN